MAADTLPPQSVSPAPVPDAPVDDLSILRTVDGWLSQGQVAAIATVIATWGSSPVRWAASWRWMPRET